MNGEGMEELGDRCKVVFFITIGISKCANRTQADNSPPFLGGIRNKSCKDDFLLVVLFIHEIDH